MPSPTSPHDKLARQSRVFGKLAAAAAVLSLIAILSQLVTVSAPMWHGGSTSLSLWNLLQQLVLSAPALFYIAGLARARHVFRRIGKGELFVQANSEGLVSVGAFLLAGSLWAIAVAGLDPAPIANEVDLTLQQLTAAASQLALVALGLALMVIGRVFASATALQTENDEFV